MFLLLILGTAMHELIQKSFRLLYSEICSYSEVGETGWAYISVFVSYIRRYVLTLNLRDLMYHNQQVFVSYIRRYVLTKKQRCNSTSNSTSVFVSYIRRYVLTFVNCCTYFCNSWSVFVSYIRRYVLTAKEND